MNATVDYTTMRYLRWRSAVAQFGTDSAAWRIERGFYSLLGRLCAQSSPQNT